MNYYYTNFYRWEQPLINALRKRGYHVYGVRDCEGGFMIDEHVIVNNVGFLVTDEKLTTPLSEAKLEKLGKEDVKLSDKIRLIADEIKGELSASKAEYEQGEAARQEAWDKIRKMQENYLERDRYYQLSLREDNPVKLSDGHSIVFQTIYDNGDGTQKVSYFICNANNKIVRDSTKMNFKRNARYMRMARDIAKSNGLAI